MVRADPSDASRRRRDDRSRLLVEHALTIRARSYVDCVLEHARNAPIVFRTAEQDAVGLGNLLAEAHPLLRGVGIKILIVKWKVPNFDHRPFEIVIAKSADRPGDFSVDASFAKAADDDRDLVGHETPHI